MAKIGNYYVPELTFSQCVEIVKTIYKNSISSDESLATKLGHSTTNSGGFIKKLVTLRQLGLIKSGIKGIQLTNLGTRIAKPLGNEEKKAYGEILSKVPLISEIRKKVGSKSPDKEGMLLALIDITGVDRAKLDKEVFRIQKIFNDAMKYASESEGLSFDDGGFEMEKENNVGVSNIIEFKTGGLYMRVPKDIDSIEQAEIILSAQKQALQKRQKK
jgi:hypothetical protein